MSTITTVEKLSEHVGKTVTLRGWVYNKSSKGKLHFVQLRDCLLYTSPSPRDS